MVFTINPLGPPFDITGSGGGSVTTPAPPDTAVQFNDGGAFGGDATFVFDKTTSTMTVSNAIGLQRVVGGDENSSDGAVALLPDSPQVRVLGSNTNYDLRLVAKGSGLVRSANPIAGFGGFIVGTGTNITVDPDGVVIDASGVTRDANDITISTTTSGAINLFGANGTTVDGGAINIFGGDSNDLDGGDVTIGAGVANGAGVDGEIFLQSGGSTIVTVDGTGATLAASADLTFGGSNDFDFSADAGGTYTTAASAIIFKNASGVEMGRIWFTDPDFSHFNSQNLYVGDLAGSNQPTDNVSAGYANTGIGASAIHEVTTGNRNTAVGRRAMFSVTEGYQNVAFGATALEAMTIGTGNVAIGADALKNGVVVSNNVSIGRASGQSNTGNFNTFIGDGADGGSWSGSTAIGNAATINGDNQIVLGHPTVTDVYCGGTSASARLHSAGVVLSENGSLELDPAGSADGKYTGITVTGTAGTTLAFGDLIYLSVTDSRWELTDADSVTTCGAVMTGMCVLAAAADGSPTTILLQGIIRADSKFPTLTIGAPVYASTTTGAVQVAAPSTSNQIVQVVGFGITGDEMYFNPSSTYYTVA